MKLNSNKSVGPNSLPIKILKSHIDSLEKALAAIINISFKEGKFPTALLLAKVTPVFKKDDPQLCSNYRPISVLSIFSKIYEKCMYTRLYSFLEKHNLLFNKQFRFRSRYSTNHAIISLIELIKKYLENGDFVCGIFIDLQKAFGTVNHEILLSKLDHYGIRGFTNDWFRSLLCNRKQYVSCSGYSSEIKETNCGVPQGSTLGPLSFLLHINDLHFAFSKLTVHYFADNTNLLFADKNIGTIESNVNYELKILVNWLRSNKLSLNKLKTELIMFHPIKKKSPHSPNIKLNNYKLKRKSHVKYLGITIDEVLSWNKHIDNLSKKLARANGILSKLRHYSHGDSSCSLPLSFQSYLLYGSLAWSFTNQGNIDCVTKMQKRCIRILTFAPFDAHTNPLFSKLGIIKVEDVIVIQKLLFMLKVQQRIVPAKILKLFQINDKYIIMKLALLIFSISPKQ